MSARTAAGTAVAPACTVVAPPGAGDVTLWWARTDVDDAALAAAAAVVDAGTRRRADRMLRREDTARVLVAHALLRTAVAAATGGDPAAVRFARRCARCGAAGHGKPFVDAPGPVPEVSLSHGGLLAVVAVAAPGVRVGVDVEPRADDPVPLRRALAGLLTAAEARVLLTAPDPDGALLRAWTGKEAVAKARGLGLGDDLARLDVLSARPVTPDDAPPVLRTGTASPRPAADDVGWARLREAGALLAFPAPAEPVRTGRRHTAAVAVLGPGTR